MVPLVYAITHGCACVAATLCFRLTVHGREHLPLRGPCILASNHASYLDPVVLGAASPRRLAFIARHDLFDVPLLGSYLRLLGAFPVHQEHAVDVESFRTALRLLGRGEAIALFPEGTRSHDGRLQTGKGGVGLLALKANVPVVPAYIAGTERALPKHTWRIRCAPVVVRFGPPLAPQAVVAGHRRTERGRALADAVMAAIAALASSITVHPGQASVVQSEG